MKSREMTPEIFTEVFLLALPLQPTRQDTEKWKLSTPLQEKVTQCETASCYNGVNVWYLEMN